MTYVYKLILVILGNALAQVHELVYLWEITFCTLRFLRLLVLLAPTDFEAQSSLLYNRLHPKIQIPNACPGNECLICEKKLIKF